MLSLKELDLLKFISREKGEDEKMKIAYIILPEQKVHEVENEKGIKFLKEYCKIDVDNYDFVVVYESKNGIIEYYSAFEIVKGKNEYKSCTS
jgi:hypothetical protein